MINMSRFRRGSAPLLPRPSSSSLAYGCGLVVVAFLGGERAPGFVAGCVGVRGLRHDTLQTSSVIEFHADVDDDLQSLIKYQWHVGIGSIATSAGS
jgi:hypothetical protein